MIRSPLMTVMTDAVMKASRSLKRDFGEVENLQVLAKGPGDFVSKADHKAEEILREALEKARPGYGFVMEESGVVHGTDESNRWHIDPLDGTHNFLRGIPHWNISVALERDNQFIAGVIYDAAKDEMMGSAALDIAYVAAGRMDAYWERGLNTWDFAAGAVLIREAGGTFGTLDGKPMTSAKDIICGNEAGERALSAALKTAAA